MPPRGYHPPMRLPIPTFFAFATLMLMGSLSAIAQTPSVAPTPPQPRACPAEVPAESRCYTGEDGQGAFYWIALPAQWDRGVLVMHAHGGPADTGPAKAERATEDLQRWAITVKAGYAWAGSTYRRGGYGITMAAEDTERLRSIFVQHFGPARRTILHGQSYGGGVASKAAELYATVDGRPGPYDGVLLTSGVLGGGSVAYDFRLDLRVVYQWVCQNHPKADEPQYPLWRGLPMDAKLTRAELAERVDACTGVRKPVAQRTEQQKANLATILNVIRIPEGSLIGHLNWATWLFRDLVQLRLPGRDQGELARLLALRVGPKGTPLSELVTVSESAREQPRHRKDGLGVHFVVADAAGKNDSPLYALFGMRAKLGERMPEMPQFFIRQPDDASRAA